MTGLSSEAQSLEAVGVKPYMNARLRQEMDLEAGLQVGRHQPFESNYDSKAMKKSHNYFDSMKPKSATTTNFNSKSGTMRH